MATLWDTPARFNHPNNIPKIETWAMAHFAKLFQVITIHNQLWPRCHFHDEYAATLKLFLSNDLTPFPINKPSLIVTLTRLNVSVKGCPLLPKVPITPQILPLFFWTSLSIMESFLETMASANSRILWSGLRTPRHNCTVLSHAMFCAHVHVTSSRVSSEYSFWIIP